MKRLFLSMILAVAFGLSFVSCNEEEVTPIQDGGQTESNPRSWD